jgi:rubrerythrin
MKLRGDIGSVEELLAHSLAIETEAVDRFMDLADQMDVHNNPEVAQLFRKLASIEQLHIEHVAANAEGLTLPHVSPWEYKWSCTDGLEGADTDDVHYMMTPYHAIKLALCGERRAADFFESVCRSGASEAVRQLAEKLASEEQEHIRLLTEWLVRYPAPDSDWSDDPDPPNLPE